MLPINLGYRHPCHNYQVYSQCCCHHYGGAVDHSSGCQNPLCPPDRPRWCSLGSIQKMAHFLSAAVYPPYLALCTW